ncbi:MAG: hypothetical protein M3Y42_13055 [Actinomycetota bacterium]|nr:hypothetical protein [Actinomycetota bacterium]MDQ2957882.1 hypothetical protein [Actinomycetota bacterium]
MGSRSELVDAPVTTAPPLVLLRDGVLDELVADAVAQYRRAWQVRNSGERYLPRCWALLIGEYGDRTLRVTGLRWANNVRESDQSVLAEFAEVIVPCFGAGYTNGRRGFWCDPAELLRITREVEDQGLDVLGAVHMHADMHRFWPEHAGGLELSECPTAMDEYLFRNGGWPLNMICHLEAVGEDITVRLGAWSPGPFEDPAGTATRCEILPVVGGR